MNKGNKISFISLIKDIRFNQNMISLNNSFELLALFRVFGFRILKAINFKARGYTTRLNFMLKFFHYLLYLQRKNGSEFVVAFLKAGQLAISKKIAGSRVKSLREINPDLNLPRLTNGLPSIIPIPDRVLIRKGSSTVIRYWLTLFSIYRIISIPGNMKLSTITDGFKGNITILNDYCNLIKGIKGKLVFSQFLPKSSNLESTIFMISKASPLHDKSWKGFYSDIPKMPENLFSSLVRFLTHTNQKYILTYVKYIREMGPQFESWGNPSHFKPFVSEVLTETFDRKLKAEVSASDFESGKIYEGGSSGHYPFGQLSLKNEAAGKIRVFAMVDYWSQVSLKGLHDYLFKILSNLPNDGTFNQQQSIQRAAEKSVKANCSFGYDLTAATDRLPLDLQISLLTSLFNEEMANSWADLLVRERFYYLRIACPGPGNALQEVQRYKYAVGQPMGALSSWAMLALTHHLIVQLSYQSVTNRKNWFEGYELLGDDIVLFDKDVAMKYLELMESFGVPINLSKSVVANNATVEFAKVVTHNGVDVSALSWKSFLSDSSSLMGRANILDFLLRKGLGLSNFSHYTRDLLRESKYSEGSSSPGFLALLTMLVNRKVFTYSWLLGLINNPKSPLQSWYATILISLREKILYETLHSYWVKANREFKLSSKMEKLRKRKEAWLNIFLMGKILMLQQKKIPSGFDMGTDYSDIKSLKERTLDYLLPLIPEMFRRDTFDFFTMAIFSPKVSLDLDRWRTLNVRKLSTIDELLEAIELYESIESHFNAHFEDKKVERKFSSESPLRILSHLVDLSKKVPPYVKDSSCNQWFS